ncbi:MAG: FHA domain-containing protein, partial [Planctomycetaceae bacterium]|nr:FHA domain-containing protein [Planctomycetaceae bacterium]
MPLQQTENREIREQTNRPAVLVLEPVRPIPGMATAFLVPGEYLLGSGQECHFRLDYPGVRPEHARIVHDGTTITATSLDNRCWLNRGLLRTAKLKAGDKLLLGPAELRVRGAKDEELDRLFPPPAPEPIEPTPTPANHLDDLATHLTSTLERTASQISRLEEMLSAEQLRKSSAPAVDLQSSLERIEDLDRQLQQRDSEIQLQQQTLIDIQNRLDADRANFNQESSQVQFSLQTQQADLEQELQKTREEYRKIQEQREGIAAQQDQTEELSERLKQEQEEWLTHREEEAKALELHQQELIEQRTKLQSEIADREESIEHQESELRDRQRDLDRQMQGLAEGQEELTRQKSDLESARQHWEQDVA